jgi:hypothetical protein
MKLANLFLITALVGVVAAIGCSDDPPPSNGNGGTGGSGTAGSGGGGGSIDVGCDEGRCVDDAEATKCKDGIAACIVVEPANEAECVAAGNLIFCDDSGAGGTGGTGGTGGAPVPSEVCDVGLCAEAGPARTECEEILALCVEYVLEAQWDECAGAARLFACEELLEG